MSDDRRARGSGTTDPLQIWRDWLDRAERQWNQTFNELMATERFGKSQARMIESLLALQAQMNQTTERYFSTLNLPTRTDVLSLGQQISQLEERVGDLERMLAAVAQRLDVAAEPVGPKRPRPKRTRKAPKSEGTDAGKTSKKRGAKKSDQKTGKKAQKNAKASRSARTKSDSAKAKSTSKKK